MHPRANATHPRASAMHPCAKAVHLRANQSGQAAVEFVALLPLAALVLAAGWQLVVAGHAVWSTGAAARAAARASALGDDPRGAARSVLPGVLEQDLEVGEPEAGRVRVAVRVPRVLGLPSLGHVSASAQFRVQR
jgi:hypothetical protein